MWGEAFEGDNIYGYYDTFRTLNGEFEQGVIISKVDKSEDALSELNADFDEFKKDNPQYKNLILY